MKPYKIDLHIHSTRSRCGANRFKVLKKYSKIRNLIMAITDHNKMTNLKNTIVGEEIKTLGGEVIGIFIQEEIKPWQDVYETLDKIKEQGGLSILAHPYDKLRRDAAKNPSKELLKRVDFVELNARSLNAFLKEVKNKIMEYKLKFVVGSDAHLPWELNRSYLVANKDHEKYTKEELINDPKKLKKLIIANNDFRNVVIGNSDVGKIKNMLISGTISRMRKIIKTQEKRK